MAYNLNIRHKNNYSIKMILVSGCLKFGSHTILTHYFRGGRVSNLGRVINNDVMLGEVAGTARAVSTFSKLFFRLPPVRLSFNMN